LVCPEANHSLISVIYFSNDHQAAFDVNNQSIHIIMDHLRMGKIRMLTTPADVRVWLSIEGAWIPCYVSFNATKVRNFIDLCHQDEALWLKLVKNCAIECELITRQAIETNLFHLSPAVNDETYSIWADSLSRQYDTPTEFYYTEFDKGNIIHQLKHIK
jgi:hypothetical protein